jgi:hypothetical protein
MIADPPTHMRKPTRLFLPAVAVALFAVASIANGAHARNAGAPSRHAMRETAQKRVAPDLRPTTSSKEARRPPIAYNAVPRAGGSVPSKSARS